MRLANRWTGVLTGKGCSYGGSAVREEATGYGCVYFCEEMLDRHGDSLDGKRVAISGAGNVALHAAEKALEHGARVVTLSDSGGMIHAKDGLDAAQLEAVTTLKQERMGRLEEFAENSNGVDYAGGVRPWRVECDVAMPCATQNELDGDDARTLIDNGVTAVCEGANMPTTNEAIELFRKNRILLAPGKAANAGGVAVSGLELSQNAMRISWSHEEVDRRLKEIMKDIHARCIEHGETDGHVDYTRGANIAGFDKVATAMVAYGVF